MAYSSHNLQPAEQKYSQIKCEALAIMLTVKCFHQYVYLRVFKLVTDHQLLCKILGPKEADDSMTYNYPGMILRLVLSKFFEFFKRRQQTNRFDQCLSTHLCLPVIKTFQGSLFQIY